MEGQAQAAEQSMEDRIAASLEPEQEQPVADEAATEQETTTEAETEPEAEVEKPEEEAPEEIDWEQIKGHKVKVTVQGEDKEVTLEEARNGFMMQADYQRKTQELAKQRNEVQETARQAVAQTQAQYAQNLQVLQQTLLAAAAPELQGVNWNQLAQTDPAEYVRLSNRAQAVNQTLQSFQVEMQRIAQANQEQMREKTTQAARQAVEVLQAKIPNWNDTLYQDLLRTGVESYGFSPEEVGNVVDPRMIQVLHDAKQWRALQSQKPIAEKKVKDAPKVMKPGAPQSKSQAAGRDTQQLRERLKKSGGKDEAAAIALIKRTF